uniref:Protein FAR1-RELATED SEQUENCE n=1 Tax=Lactuca sativa TaxID=4236 RepID=A0A9R1UY63_LACSA|nr:hypothetical protein LSAT_V11C700374650 [Lactuca sativa]
MVGVTLVTLSFPRSIQGGIGLLLLHNNQDVTDIESYKERKDDCLDQPLVITGKSYWIPTVPDDLKPILDHKYPSDDAIEYITTKWWLYEFEEKHNHPLISRDNMLFSRHHRQLDDTQKSFILTISNQNIGATIAHTLYTSTLGGYNFVGGLIDDFKSYMRDLNCFIGGSDAQMLVDKLNNIKENVMNFSFEYRVENKQLNALFWGDETSKINYKEFGDVLSFDATFRTNRLEVDEFEVGWKSLLNEYKLTYNKWLDDMHGLRHFWIPAFYKHVPLSGLMRTTSHSENAMEKQRFAQSSFDFKTNDKHPTMRTPFEIERNASLFYTHTVFRQVHNEMYLSMVSCSQICISTFDDVDECLVKEFINYIPSKSNCFHIDPEVENDDQ